MILTTVVDIRRRWPLSQKRDFGASNASSHLAILVRMRSTGSLQTKTVGFWSSFFRNSSIAATNPGALANEHRGIRFPLRCGNQGLIRCSQEPDPNARCG